MKKIVLLLAAAGLASATAITFVGGSSGVLTLDDSGGVAAPSGISSVYGFSTNSVGGLCLYGNNGINCPDFGGGNTMDILTFTIPSASTLRIQLEDNQDVGDVYQVLLSNNSTGNSVINTYNSSNVVLGDVTSQACANPGLATGAGHSANSSNSNADGCIDVTTGTLGAGNYSITVWNALLASVSSTDPNGQNNGGSICTGTISGGTVVPGCMTPSGFEMELTLTPVAVPEPATLGMLGLGGIALGLLRRRRTSK